MLDRFHDELLARLPGNYNLRALAMTCARSENGCPVQAGPASGIWTPESPCSVGMSLAPTEIAGKWVDAFVRAAIRGPFDYPACHHFAGTGEHDHHLVLSFVVHGNEFGTLPAALALQQELSAEPPAGPVTLLLGNVEAVRRGERFLDEDYNRVFTFDRPADNRERLRAEQVRPILDSARLLVDFHQTQTPTEAPFWTFPFRPELAHWARIIGGAERVLTRAPGTAFSAGLKCLDEYVRDQGQTGMTLEVGFRGEDPVQAGRTLEAARRTLSVVSELARGKTTLEDLSAQAPALSFFQTEHIVMSTPTGSRLRPGLSNWVELRAGEALHAEDSEEILCPFDGVALFPKYPTPGQEPPPELLRIARPVAKPFETFGS